MNIKSDYSNKKIVLEGCNGDWSQKRYLPFLAEGAVKGDIKLWAIDVEDEIQLKDPQIKKSWETAQSDHKAHYLNKIKNEQSYTRLSDATHVFIVTPDQYHCQIARFWLARLAPKGKIFIEKPVDAVMKAAVELGQSIKEGNKEDTVFVFSHYLARVRDRNLDQIGEVERIKFHILESSTVPQNRAKTLSKGVIFDLFGHVLALSGALIERNLTPSKSILQRVALREVKAARYLGCPIAGETFSQIKFAVDNIEVTSLIGKGIGTVQDDKVMTIYGSKGTIKLDFVSNASLVFDHQGQEKSRGRLNPRHVESFLEEVIEKDKPPLAIPGVLDFDVGIEILAILSQAKMRIEKIPDYQAGESINSILERLKLVFEGKLGAQGSTNLLR